MLVRPMSAALTDPSPSAVALLDGVTVRIGGRPLLADVRLEIREGERWALLGPNGSGKTTLLRVLGGYLHPSAGHVELLGRALGQTDVGLLRARIGQAGPALRALVRDTAEVGAVVVSGASGVLEPAYRAPTDAESARARELLASVGCGALLGRRLGTLSSGEQQRVGVARALMPDPDLLLLDEPFAGLDLAGREGLIAALGSLAAASRPAAIVLVVHHLEEIPVGFDRVALLRAGRLVSAGPPATALTGRTLSRAFDVRLRVTRRSGRYQGLIRPGT
jgi:iron complex transport system ATP-binding protein